MNLSRSRLTLEHRSPLVKNKLDSVMARLDRLCSEEGGDSASWSDDEHKRWLELFV